MTRPQKRPQKTHAQPALSLRARYRISWLDCARYSRRPGDVGKQRPTAISAIVGPYPPTPILSSSTTPYERCSARCAGPSAEARLCRSIGPRAAWFCADCALFWPGSGGLAVLLRASSVHYPLYPSFSFFFFSFFLPLFSLPISSLQADPTCRVNHNSKHTNVETRPRVCWSRWSPVSVPAALSA